jgi:hypothetical protein
MDLSQDRWCSGRESNHAPTEYKSGATAAPHDSIEIDIETGKELLRITG